MTDDIEIRAGVIGYPVAHSKSPAIHGYWIGQYALNGRYDAIEVAPEDLREKIAGLIERGYAGFNVTLPHKQSIIPHCAALDDSARAIGAVNTVRIDNGRLFGSNTDAFGFLENLRQSVPGFNLRDKRAVLLGAGGAVRAIVHALLTAGLREIILCNRTRDKADEIASFYPGRVRVAEWGEREEALADCDLLVNGTSLGMTGQAALEIDLDRLAEDAVVCDIVYAPLMTNLLTRAAARGNPVVTGIGMLLHQARPGFALWFGIFPEVDEALRRKVLA